MLAAKVMYEARDFESAPQEKHPPNKNQIFQALETRRLTLIEKKQEDAIKTESWVYNHKKNPYAEFI